MLDFSCDFCSSEPGGSADQSEAECNGPRNAVGDSGRHTNGAHCSQKRSDCLIAVESDAVPYYGTLTGIANTGGSVYACGQPMNFGDTTSAAFFLFRLNLGDNKVALVQEVVPLAWLGSDERSKMGVEKCMVSHQPGWGGRGSASMGDGPRLWIAPKATGADAWAATARGCWLNLPQNAAPNCDPEQQPGCDCNGKECTNYEATLTGRLSAPGCFLKQKTGSVDSVGDVQTESWLAFLTSDPSEGGFWNAGPDYDIAGGLSNEGHPRNLLDNF